MLLKSLKLKDFRQFKGEQEITFSTDPVRNVTVIMGENGSGKTTLAQAFTWCLYGDTDFDDKSMLCKATGQTMLPGNEEKVRVELALQHNNIDYLCIREQLYSKDNSGSIRRHNQTTFKIAYKNADGQREYVPDGETELRMKEILPKELSKYFFFDGERIGNMSKEIRKGKSAEFAQAVRSLLGLSAFQSALEHLGGRNSVIKMYNESYDTKSDSKMAQYTKEIGEYEEKLQAIEERLAAIDGEEAIATDKKAELEEEIRQNKDSEILARERDELVRKIQELVAKKASSEDSLLKVFNNNAHSYFAKKMISDALSQLAAADKIDTGIPYIHAKTIEFLIKRKKCICGADIEFGNEAYKELNELLEFIPPQSIGTSIGQFVRECELRCKSSDTLFEDISTKFGLNIDKWDTMKETVKAAISSGWQSIKYLNEEGTGVNPEIKQIPNDCGGIYVFLLKPDKIPQLHRYIMYIGRARRASNFSLRQRCAQYINDSRPKVADMMSCWGKELYLFYLPIKDSDDFIDQVERELIRVIIPPCNSNIPDHYILPEEKMF